MSQLPRARVRAGELLHLIRELNIPALTTDQIVDACLKKVPDATIPEIAEALKIVAAECLQEAQALEAMRARRRATTP